MRHAAQRQTPAALPDLLAPYPQQPRTKASRERASKLAQLRAEGDDPTNTAEARERRSASLSARKQEQFAWEQAARHKPLDVDFATDVLPHLQNVALAAMQQATGLSLSSCSKIRSGRLTPHVRHWVLLQQLATGRT